MIVRACIARPEKRLGRLHRHHVGEAQYQPLQGRPQLCQTHREVSVEALLKRLALLGGVRGLGRGVGFVGWVSRVGFQGLGLGRWGYPSTERHTSTKAGKKTNTGHKIGKSEFHAIHLRPCCCFQDPNSYQLLSVVYTKTLPPKKVV